MKKHRIVLLRTETAFGDPVNWYAVQVRVAIFWWITIETMGTLTQARYYLYKSGATKRTSSVIKVIE